VFTNENPALNSDLNDLLSHLEGVFTAEGSSTGAVTADKFLDFAKGYLSQNRPSEVFAVDNNYGVLLTNGQRIKLCPTAADEAAVTGGDMANPDTSIPVTRRR
jgi:hypothetical protein